jgi:opacity protein-like surface antigen
LSHESQNRLLVALAAAAGAVGAAAMMSTATASTARADQFSELVDDVQADFSTAQTDFTLADTDFSGGASGVPDGLEADFAGFNNEILASYQSVVGGFDILTGQPGVAEFVPVTPDPPEADFATGLADAESDIPFAGDEFSSGATELSSGDYSLAAVFYAEGLFILNTLPAENLLSGAVDQLLGSI